MEFVGKLEQGNHSCLTLPTMQQTADPELNCSKVWSSLTKRLSTLSSFRWGQLYILIYTCILSIDEFWALSMYNVPPTCFVFTDFLVFSGRRLIALVRAGIMFKPSTCEFSCSQTHCWFFSLMFFYCIFVECCCVQLKLKFCIFDGWGCRYDEIAKKIPFT